MYLKVTWIDSGTYHADGWEKKEEILERARIGKVVSVGILFHEDDDAIYLALSHDPDHDTYFGVQVIQQSSILQRNDLAISWSASDGDNIPYDF